MAQRIAVTHAETRRIVLAAIERGWVYNGRLGNGHHEIEYPPTGDRLSFSGSPKVASWKSLASDIERISGRGTVWRKAQRKYSKKNTTHTEFSATHTPYKQVVVRDSCDEAAEQYAQIWERMRTTGHLSPAMARKLLILEKNMRSNYKPCPIPDTRWFSEFYDDPPGD